MAHLAGIPKSSARRWRWTRAKGRSNPGFLRRGTAHAISAEAFKLIPELKDTELGAPVSSKCRRAMKLHNPAEACRRARSAWSPLGSSARMSRRRSAVAIDGTGAPMLKSAPKGHADFGHRQCRCRCRRRSGRRQDAGSPWRVACRMLALAHRRDLQKLSPLASCQKTAVALQPAGHLPNLH